jgi:hypothetical protein
VRYVEDTSSNEDMLFCKPTKRKAAVKELLKIVGFMKEKSIKGSDCIEVFTDAASVMAGNKGLQAFIERPAPEAMWAHCKIHRGSLATKVLCPELSENDGYSDKTVNSSNEEETFCRIVPGNRCTVSVIPVPL